MVAHELAGASALQPGSTAQAAQAGGAGAPAAGPGERPVGMVVLSVALTAYLVGVGLWLLIGLVPTIARDVPPVHRWVTGAAGRGGFWRLYADRVLHPSMAMSATGVAVATQYLFSVLNVGLGVVLLLRRRDRTVPRLLTFALFGTAATFNHPSHQLFDIIGRPAAVQVVHFTFHIVSGVTYIWAVALFPDATVPPGLRSSNRAGRRFSRIGTAAVVTGGVALICWRSSFLLHPQFFVVFFGILIPAVGIECQTLRLRRPASALQASQSRLLRAALTPALLVAVTWVGAWSWSHLDLPGGGAAVGLDHGLAAAFPAFFAVVPIMLLVGVLRYRLWEVDVVVSRVALFTMAVVLTGAVYATLVTAAAAVAGSGALAAVVAMAVAGVAVHPALGLVRRTANRIAFGQPLDPVEALRSLAEGLEQMAPAGALQELTRVLVAGTRASRAQVWVGVDDHAVCVASSPVPAVPPAPVTIPAGPAAQEWCAAIGADAALPVTRDGRGLGVLSYSLPPGVTLPVAEVRLVADLAAEAGVLVHNARMTVELADHLERLDAQAGELRLSRQRVVAASDQERRDLERDLHDGAQQDLIALLLTMSALAATGPEPADLEALAAMARSARATVTELCTGGAPKVLAAGGLEPALREATSAVRAAGLVVDIEVDLDERPPADVEIAVYFCCLEAVQNAAKHARGSSMKVRIAASDDSDELVLLAVDDGAGFELRPDAPSSGLRHMGERLEVLGGRIEIRSAPGCGTRIVGRVPVARSSRPGWREPAEPGAGR